MCAVSLVCPECVLLNKKSLEMVLIKIKTKQLLKKYHLIRKVCFLYTVGPITAHKHLSF